ALAQRRQNAAEQRRDRSPDENAEESRPHEPKRAGIEALRRKRVIRSEPHGSSTSQGMASMAVFSAGGASMCTPTVAVKHRQNASKALCWTGAPLLHCVADGERGTFHHGGHGGHGGRILIALGI